MLYFATSRGELNVIISRRTCGAGRPQVGLCPIFLVLRYRAVSILGSRPWPFRVTWCHWSRDHLIPNSQVAISYRCSIGTNSVSPAVFEIFGPKYIGGHDLDLFWKSFITISQWTKQTVITNRSRFCGCSHGYSKLLILTLIDSQHTLHNCLL